MTTIEEIKAQLGSLTTRQISRDRASGIIDALTDFVESISTGSAIPANTVVSETTFGTGSTAGVASTYSRSDHTHGSPTNPVLTALIGFSKITVGTGSPSSPNTGDLWVVVD